LSRDTLIVFLKRPRAGEVKTRLAVAVGAEAAARFYRVLADEEIRRTAPAAGEYRRLFFFAPVEATAEIAGWLPGETLLPQRGLDLGARMAQAFTESFARGAQRVAIIGTDVPWVSRDTVLEALAALDRADVVLGPSDDGGYYLLATARARPEMFEGIAWGSASVLAATLQKAEALNLRVRQLASLPDIDTLEDVHAAWSQLKPLLMAHPDLLQSLTPS
jgi:rSAM/selenodomain-associated transferase 1